MAVKPRHMTCQGEETTIVDFGIVSNVVHDSIYLRPVHLNECRIQIPHDSRGIQQISEVQPRNEVRMKLHMRAIGPFQSASIDSPIMKVVICKIEDSRAH
jgi:hypothetical protein